MTSRHQRLICASPAYLKRRGAPQVTNDLTQHNCIAVRQDNEAYGIWHLSSGQRSMSVKVRGNLSSNDGEVALNWALVGHGLVMRAEWDIAKYLDNGRLRQVLEGWQTPPADIYAVCPQSLQTAARVRAFVDDLPTAFATAAPRPLKRSR